MDAYPIGTGLLGRIERVPEARRNLLTDLNTALTSSAPVWMLEHLRHMLDAKAFCLTTKEHMAMVHGDVELGTTCLLLVELRTLSFFDPLPTTTRFQSSKTDSEYRPFMSLWVVLMSTALWMGRSWHIWINWEFTKKPFISYNMKPTLSLVRRVPSGTCSFKSFQTIVLQLRWLP